MINQRILHSEFRAQNSRYSNCFKANYQIPDLLCCQAQGFLPRPWRPWILCPAMNLTDNCAKYYRSAVLKHLQVMSTSFLSTSGRIFADKAHEWQGFRFFARKNHRKFWVFSALKHRSLLKLTFSCIFVIYRTRRVSLTTETWKVLVAFKSYGLKSRKLRKLPRAKHYFTREIYIYISCKSKVYETDFRVFTLRRHNFQMRSVK